MAEFSLRSARPDELQQIVAIDDQATGLFAEAGLDIALDKEHPFVVAESLRWANAIEEGRAHVGTPEKSRSIAPQLVSSMRNR